MMNMIETYMIAAKINFILSNTVNICNYKYTRQTSRYKLTRYLDCLVSIDHD